MHARILLLFLLLAGGCRSPSETLLPERLPYPVGEVFLPVYPTEIPHSVRMNVRALILADGSVQTAQISPPSGNALWDSLATAAILRWQFAPAMQGGRAVPAWIRFPVTLRFSDPHPLLLAEIVLPSRTLADSIYALLQRGGDFGALARQYSASSTAADSGFLGARALKDFSAHVQMAITSVGPGQVTAPVYAGGFFVIYKRLEEQKATE